MVARVGALSVAAHQICLQLWLSASLLVEAQASAAQALIATSFAKGEYSRVKETTISPLKTGLITGVSLAIVLGFSLPSLTKLFTSDFVSASLPLNALAYIFDGLHNGVSDFPYAGCSLMAAGATSSAFLVYTSSTFGLPGAWSGLTLFMLLRSVAGFLEVNRAISIV